MRGSRLSAVLATLLALGLVSAEGLAQEETCPEPSFRLQLLTPMTGRHPRDAALLVGLVPGSDGAFRQLPPLMLARRRREIATVTEPIAPGLWRVRPDTRRIYGRYTLSGVAGEPQVLFGRTPSTAPPPAPRLERVERYLVASASGERIEVRAHFQFPVPDGVVAVVAFWGDDAAPDLYARAVPTSTESVLFSQTGNCRALPPGATAPPESGSVRVAFVDELGQMSAPSEARSLGN